MLADQFTDMRGTQIQVLVLAHFPYIDYQQHSSDSTAVSLRDSLDTRMISTIAKHLNFT